MFIVRASRLISAGRNVRWLASHSSHDVVPMPAQSILRVVANSSFVDVASSMGVETGSIEVGHHQHQQPCLHAYVHLFFRLVIYGIRLGFLDNS